ncbi:MAG: hypothetical protein ACXWC7_19375, partial [Chitinophagaceae bacterium]
VENNISLNTSAAQFGSLNGNQSNVTYTAVFIGYPSIGTNSSDGRFRLQNPGPAIGTGYGGIDVGAYGGSTAYKLSGISNVPSIYKLDAPAVVTGNTMNITISTKTNN